MKYIVQSDDVVLSFIEKVLESKSNEAKITAYFLKRYNYYINDIKLTDEETIWRIIFDLKSRKECREKLGISVSVFNTAMTLLKKKGILLELDNGVPCVAPVLRFNPLKDNELVFIFKPNK